MKNKSNRLPSSLSTSYSTPLGVSLSAIANSHPSDSDSMANSYSTLSGFSTTSVSSYGSSSSWISQSSSLSSIVDLQDTSLEDEYWRNSQYDFLASIPEEPASPRLEQSHFTVAREALLKHAKATARAMSLWDYFMSAVFAFFLWLLLCALWGQGKSVTSTISCAPVPGDNPHHTFRGYPEEFMAPDGIPQETLLQLPATPSRDDGSDGGLGNIAGGHKDM